MPAEHIPLTFDELLGELREFGGRVIGVEIRLASGEVTARMEGEFNGVHRDDEDPDDVWFELGGKEPPARDGIEFIVASWASIPVPRPEVASAWRDYGGIGAFHVHIAMRDGRRISVWPAMPPRQQWTAMHNESR